MKNLAALLMTVFASSAFSQVTITSAEMPAENEDHFYSYAPDGLTIDLNNTGASSVWDYSALTYVSQDSINYVSVTSTPLAYQLYFNNAILYPSHKADYAVVGQDFDAFQMVTISNRFDYFKVESGALKLTGFGAEVNSLPASVKYDTIDQIYPLPMTLGVQDSTTAYYFTSIPSVGAYGQWIRRKVEVDGEGQLTTPYAQYDAVRVKTTLYQRDTIYIDQLGFGNEIDRPVEEIYEWFAEGEEGPVMSVTTNAGQITEVKYKDELHVGVSELSSNFQVFPNPTNYTLTFTERMTGRVLNGLGAVVLHFDDAATLDVSELETGVYFVEFVVEAQRSIVKFIKR